MSHLGVVRLCHAEGLFSRAEPYMLGDRLHVTLWTVQVPLNRLVCHTHVEAMPEGAVVIHKDKNKLNCTADNLMWSTMKDVRAATTDPVYQCAWNDHSVIIATFKNAEIAAQKVNVKPSTLRTAICRGTCTANSFWTREEPAGARFVLGEQVLDQGGTAQPATAQPAA